MSEQREKLVEEMPEKLKTKLTHILADIFLAEAHEKDEELFNEGLGALIACILSAVRDGRLDEELGVKGRTSESYKSDVWMLKMFGKGARTFIALSGTGKGEE